MHEKAVSSLNHIVTSGNIELRLVLEGLCILIGDEACRHFDHSFKVWICGLVLKFVSKLDQSLFGDKFSECCSCLSLMLSSLVKENDLSTATSFDSNKAKSAQILILFSKFILKHSKHVNFLTFARLLDGSLTLFKTDDQALKPKIMSSIPHLVHILINGENHENFSQYLIANGQMIGDFLYFFSQADVGSGQDVDTFINIFIKSNSKQLHSISQSKEYKEILAKFGHDSEPQSFLFTFFDTIPKSVASLPKVQAKLLFDYLLRLVFC